ncbi:AAA family ATPase [Lacipirellula parvula]|uniref:Putative ATPase n=1 Tax=Lacipirellula parvula TaxID=2650471 RepID=A0A5K7X2W5_9BACT|nr:AAA family ATPase [Lacipirellula parvula]BBO30998.1 putative ATPase [Lacipirellula parvula]
MRASTLEPPKDDLLESLLGGDAYRPPEPQTLEETGLSPVVIETLILKYLLQVGSASGREIAARICLPFRLLEELLLSLRSRQMVVHKGQSQLSDYYYALTDVAQERARVAAAACAYVGPAPVPLDDYIMSVEAQTIRAEAVRRRDVEQAFGDVSVDGPTMELLGPAINSGAGLFLYGFPGNGKTTIAKRITRCFGQHMWIPQTIVEDGQIVKLYDAAFHEAVRTTESNIIKVAAHDQRWIKIRRPTVVVGGELTMDSLEIRHDANTNVSEASLQMKSNGGCLLIDDFGRQRIEPAALLNRWIVPLENRHDYLTLATGKKIQVPFDQLIIFSTNLEPTDLADEAFLRRIPYKIEIVDPSIEEFRKLFQSACLAMGCPYQPQAVDYLVQTHYRPYGRPLRRCHARDLLAAAANYCVFNDTPMQLTPQLLDRVAKSYFTALNG